MNPPARLASRPAGRGLRGALIGGALLAGGLASGAACRPRAGAARTAATPPPAARIEAPLLEVEGTVHATYGDPAPGAGGTPAYRLALTTDAGRQWDVTAAPDVVAAPHTLDRQRARLWLDTTDARRLPPRVRRLVVTTP